MTDKKIPDLPAASALDGTELLEIVQAGASAKAAASAVAALGVNTFDAITTGSSPVAADPETRLTLITTGGTKGVEVVTLAAPSNPDDKIGFEKTIFLAHQTNGGDQLSLDTTNVVGALLNPMRLGGAFSFRWYRVGWLLIDVFSGSRNLLSDNVTTPDKSGVQNGVRLLGGNASTSTWGGAATVQGGQGPLGRGGAAQLVGGQGGTGPGGPTIISPGNGSTDGGDVQITLPGAGSGRQGLVIIDGAGLPTIDPHVTGALWNNLGIVTVSAG